MKKKELQEHIDLLADTIVRQQDRIHELITENDRLTLKYEPYVPPKHPKCLSISLDLWPLGEWWRFNWKGWNPGKYAQLNIGPLRVDFFQS